MTAAVKLHGSVLPAELPEFVYVDTYNLIAHSVSHESFTDCWVSKSECDEYPSSEAWKHAGGWCFDCFTEARRCSRRISDRRGLWTRVCHQPSADGDTCLMHIREDNDANEPFERAA